MDATDAGDFDPGIRAVDHVELEDGTLLLFDPDGDEAWIQCRSPVSLLKAD